MEKVLVEVYIPVVNTSIDVFIPKASPMYEVSALIKEAVTELSKGRFVTSDQTALCYRDSGAIINVNMKVHELGIHNGSKLMLI